MVLMGIQITNLDKPIELSPLQLIVAIIGIFWLLLKSGPVLQNSLRSWKEIFTKVQEPELIQNAMIEDHEKRIAQTEEKVDKCLKYLDKDKTRLEGVDEWILDANKKFEHMENELTNVQKTTTHINDAIEVLIDGQIATMQALGRQLPDDVNLEKKTNQLMDFLTHGVKGSSRNQ